MSIRRIPVLSAATMAVLLAGCSGEVSIGTKSLSGTTIADAIQPEYRSQTGIEMTRLVCKSADGEAGAAIDCRGRNAKDIEIELGGEITGVDGDTVDYRWEVVRAFSPGRLYATAAQRRIERAGGGRVNFVRCPARIEIVAGAKVACVTVTRTGAEIPTELTLTDLDGGFNLRTGSVRPAPSPPA